MEISKSIKIKEVARLVEIDPSHISRIFNHKSRPSPELAEKLEAVLGVDRLAWLYPHLHKNPYIKTKKG